jgi:hypothetical protein
MNLSDQTSLALSEVTDVIGGHVQALRSHPEGGAGVVRLMGISKGAWQVAARIEQQARMVNVLHFLSDPALQAIANGDVDLEDVVTKAATSDMERAAMQIVDAHFGLFDEADATMQPSRQQLLAAVMAAFVEGRDSVKV